MARGIALLAFVLTLASCGGTRTEAPSPTAAASTASPAPAFPITVVDDDGVTVTLEVPPQRIVTFAPSNTELVFALGLGDRLVGVSGRFDDYPPEALAVERVGGGEFGVEPNVEKVLALEPDLFLAISGGEEWKARLRDLGIAVFTVDATDFGDLLEDILTLGRLTGTSARAEALAAEMAERAEAVAVAIDGRPPVTCFFEVSPPPTLFTVGPSSFIFDLLVRAGCDPVTSDATTAYPEWSVEELVRADPDVYLVSSEAGGSVEDVAGRPGYRSLTAVEGGRVFLIDSDLVSRPGPRVVDGLEALAGALHPAVRATSSP